MLKMGMHICWLSGNDQSHSHHELRPSV